jgi:thiamine kinase-like enzyme
MIEKNSSLDFLCENPTMVFRAIKRKGELRYIASNQRGSLKAVTRFAPPTKRLPRMILSILGLVDFKILGFRKVTSVSKSFLEQSGAALKIPVDRVGLYVGEPNEQQKLVIIDVAGESTIVLKMAIGPEADAAIEREAQGSHLAAGSEKWTGMIPDIQHCDPICGRPTIRIERIEGRQLAPEEFEEDFFSEKSSFKQQVLSFKDGEISIGEWLNQNHKSYILNLKTLIDACRECGALELRSEIGVIHGDFAPWNVIYRNELSVKTRVPCVEQSEFLKPNDMKLKTGRNQALYLIDWEFSQKAVPLLFDYAYAAWCYSELLGRSVASIDSILWKQLVALGSLWKELRHFV